MTSGLWRFNDHMGATFLLLSYLGVGGVLSNHGPWKEQEAVKDRIVAAMLINITLYFMMTIDP